MFVDILTTSLTELTWLRAYIPTSSVNVPRHLSMTVSGVFSPIKSSSHHITEQFMKVTKKQMFFLTEHRQNVQDREISDTLG
jgi:hypothetical protein